VVEGEVDEQALIAFARLHLAAYKTPKRVVPVDSVGRAPNGKVDHPRLRAVALAHSA
jgi:acyl-CoA synthetase (AMP-forming)/AMP-acid ligase II